MEMKNFSLFNRGHIPLKKAPSKREMKILHTTKMLVMGMVFHFNFVM
jgi:hypothetical protein